MDVGPESEQGAEHEHKQGGKRRRYFATLERPHLVLDALTRAPTHLITGASPLWDSAHPAAPCGVCDARKGNNHSCVVCKTTAGYDWTFTLVQSVLPSAAI